MNSKDYGEAPLWRVLETVAAWETDHVVLSLLARRLLAKSGYPGAYEAIGRAVAAGYLEYDMPDTAAISPARTCVRLTNLGRVRVLAGPNYPQGAVARWRARTVPAPRHPRWRMWHVLH